ncbi:MAG TPA: hypothetical protein VMY42_08695 [Thermoguttaceae bacterium]|nr:hypothetical protein [Thermoguttaceae bacterium]
MYACRPAILERADGCESLDSAYFTQTLLPDYMAAHPDETADWDVVWDARGSLSEPHTQEQVPLGSLGVRRYLRAIKEHAVGEVIPTIVGAAFPTMGPTNRYSAILFIEKEGFMPLFESVALAERFDIAIMSSKGMSSTACRELADTLCGRDVPLLVLHDFDKSGFSILGTLSRDTRRFTFTGAVNVIDLGLRLEDVEEYQMQSEPCFYGKTDPKWNLKENGATEAEIAFLVDSGARWHGYKGQRVELNAFSSGALIEWLEKKLRAHGVAKLVPDDQTIETAYRRAAMIEVLNKKAEEGLAEARRTAQCLEVNAASLRKKIKRALKRNPQTSWDQAVGEILAEEADRE